MLPIFLLGDMIWLGGIAKGFYSKNLGHLMRETPDWITAAVFYLLYVIGILIFAIIPAMEKRSLFLAIILGALFGFFTYATYDLTNRATLRDWPLLVVLVDIAWGALLTAATACASFMIANKYNLMD